MILFILILKCFLTLEASVDDSTFPWDGQYEARFNEILETLQSDLTMNVQPHLVSQDIKDGKTIKFRNRAGYSLNLGLQKLNEIEPLPPHITDPTLLDNQLAGYCAVLPDSWWNYEWCHKKEIKQFHLEPLPKKAAQQAQLQQRRGTNGVPNNSPATHIRNPDFSLGSYDRTRRVVVRRGNNQYIISAPIARIHDYYANGQYCDETGMSRTTEVVVQCCPEVYHTNLSKTKSQPPLPSSSSSSSLQQQQQQHTHTSSSLKIKTVSEPSQCSYLIEVCYDDICIGDNNINTTPKTLTLLQVSW